MQHISLSFDDLCRVDLDIRLKLIDGQWLFDLEPAMNHKVSPFSSPLASGLDAGRLYSAHSLNFQMGYDHMGPLLRVYTSFDTSKLFNNQSNPSLFYSPSSGSTSLFGTEHAADARSQIGDFPSAFKSLDGKLLEEVLNPALPSWPSNPVFDSNVYNHPNLGPSKSFNDMRINDDSLSSSGTEPSPSSLTINRTSPSRFSPGASPSGLPSDSVTWTSEISRQKSPLNSSSSRSPANHTSDNTLSRCREPPREDNEGKCFPCSIPGCTRRFKSQHTLKSHMEAHTHKPKRPTLFICTHGCSEQFTRQHDRLRHEVSKHGKVCDWRCEDCNRFFSTQKTLAHHKCPMMAGKTRWVN